MTGSRDIPIAVAKEQVIKFLRQGMTVEAAMRAVGKSRKTYEYYMKDEAFNREVKIVRQLLAGAGPERRVPPFAEFSAKYLHQTVFPHQQNWIDVLEGKRPSQLHRAMTYRRGEPDLVLINTPPEHAKTTTITVNYTTWRIAQDPNIKVIYVSRGRDMAQKFLTEIKGRLTHPRFADFQNTFGPVEGYSRNSPSWTQTKIYLSDDIRTSTSKDPTVEALGIRGQIYGARADLIILDDCVDGTNAHEFEKQISWIQGEVMSRLSGSGVLLIVGTRMAPVDLYSEIQKPHYYPDEVSPWTYLAQPAVLEFADETKDWVTLWPKSNEMEPGAKGDRALADENGLYPKWDGPALAKRRARLSPRRWAMIYQQQQVQEDSIFPVEAVNGCVDGSRMTGPLSPETGHRKEGMAGLYVVGGLDPAMAGNTAAVCYAVDRATRKRWVLEVFNGTTTPDEIRDLMKDWTVKYNMHEWRVEKNAFQIMLTQDRDIRQFLASRGCLLREHFTGNNKWDTDFGVASMRDLFGTWQTKVGGGYVAVIPALISLPSRQGEPVKALVEQLTTWYPDAPKTQKTDTVMALWFAEIRARELLDEGFGMTHLPNPFVAQRQNVYQESIDLDEYFAAQQQRNLGGL